MLLNDKTYGDTPAALYLVRALNKEKDPSLNRKIGVRITNVSRQVRELSQAYENGFISPSTFANSLRLLRNEVSLHDALYHWGDYDPLFAHLTKNVCIGFIKRGIRQATLAQKAYTVMSSPVKRSKFVEKTPYADLVYFRDEQTDKIIMAGYISTTSGAKYVNAIGNDQYDTKSAAALMEKSIKRCTRLNKPHTKENA